MGDWDSFKKFQINKVFERVVIGSLFSYDDGGGMCY